MSKNSDLVKKGTMTEQIKKPEKEITFKETYEHLEEEYRKGQNLIKYLRKKICLFGRKGSRREINHRR